jgi:hypothetical protein
MRPCGHETTTDKCSSCILWDTNPEWRARKEAQGASGPVTPPEPIPDDFRKEEFDAEIAAVEAESEGCSSCQKNRKLAEIHRRRAEAYREFKKTHKRQPKGQK